MIFIFICKKKSFSFGITESNVIWRPTDLMVSVLDSESSLRHLTRRTGLHFGHILGEQRRSAKKKTPVRIPLYKLCRKKFCQKSPFCRLQDTWRTIGEWYREIWGYPCDALTSHPYSQSLHATETGIRADLRGHLARKQTSATYLPTYSVMMWTLCTFFKTLIISGIDLLTKTPNASVIICSWSRPREECEQISAQSNLHVT